MAIVLVNRIGVDELPVQTRDNLNVLLEEYNNEKRANPADFTYKMSHLSFRIMRIKIRENTLTPEEHFEFIGGMLEFANYVKSQSEKDYYLAKSVYERILKFDQYNAEANYRSGFIEYKGRNWSSAIQFFRQALDPQSNEDFPLSKDQIIKANLFISICSIELANEALRDAEKLIDREEVLVAEGISVEELKSNVLSKLRSYEITMISEAGTESVSNDVYEEMLQKIGMDRIVVSFVDRSPLFVSRLGERNVSITTALLLKRLLLKSLQGEALSLNDLTGYQEEEVLENLDNPTWSAYRQKVRRLKSDLTHIGMDHLIENVLGKQSYKIKPTQFTIFTKDDQYLK